MKHGKHYHKCGGPRDNLARIQAMKTQVEQAADEAKQTLTESLTQVGPRDVKEKKHGREKAK